MYDDFLEQLPISTNQNAKGKELVPKILGLRIDEGFYDKGNWLRDANTSMSGLELFRKWFLQRNHDTPLNNVWEFDIGKLVIPDVLIDDNFLTMFEKRYDPMLQVVKNHAGDNLFGVTNEVIIEVFILNPNLALHEKIDFDDL